MAPLLAKENKAGTQGTKESLACKIPCVMVSHPSVKEAALESLLLDCLPRATRRAFLQCVKFPFLARGEWYLAGGTALALQVGHRQSVDLDFFCPRPHINETALERTLMTTGEWTTDFREEGTLFGIFAGAKMSFIAYPFFIPRLQIKIERLRMLQAEDIAAMKIVAISQRGRKRDFVDLFWYCTHREPLAEVVQRAIKQFPGQERNVPHILKSLVYFADAEADPMPRIFFKTTWREVKRYFEREVPKLTREFLGLS